MSVKTVQDYLDNGQSEVMIAGGSRKGQPHFLVPCFHSSQYCLRHYLVKD